MQISKKKCILITIVALLIFLLCFQIVYIKAKLSFNIDDVLRKENIDNLRKNGIIFNLNPTEEVIKKRLSSAAATRPLLKKDDIQDALDRFETRKPFYDNCDFKIQIDTNTTIEFAAKEIIEIYSNFQKNGGK